MANIKVKFRKSTVNGRPGTIYYQVCHNYKHKHITTKMRILPEDWDEEHDCVINVYDKERYNRKINNDLLILNKVIKDLSDTGLNFTVSDIIEHYYSSEKRITIFQYMQKQIDGLNDKHKYGTANNYKCALNSFSMFLDKKDALFNIMNEGAIQNYGEWLERRNVKKNSISFYMRIWRAVYNRAVRENIINETHPFNKVYTGIEHTVKRAVCEDTIMKIVKLDLEKRPTLCIARDLFLFSYCTRGMSFIDIAFLKKNNIHNNVITYRRRKTEQVLSVYMEPCIKYIINKYRNETRKSMYVFPIITATDEITALRQYRSALNNYNRKLKLLAKKAHVSESLSSYTSRHSWATTARNHNIPISIISAGMGHTSERTTQIYLASLENSVIDDANKNVLSEINSITSC